MSGITLSGTAARKSPQAIAWTLFASWFVVVLMLGLNNFFVPPRGTPPLTLLIANTAPVILFFLSVFLFPSIRQLVLSVDLRFATAVQAWRLGGNTFLILYSFGYLPGYFAWPAGVGDLLIGATAPLILGRMIKPGFIYTRTFVAWNVLGILDLVVAVSMGALGSLLLGNPAGPFPPTILSQMPLVLIPTFFVPVFVILHLVALMQARSKVEANA
jgi:hypothetical protein